MAGEISVEVVSWERHHAALSLVRFEVFVEEQQVPQEIELDEWDPRCLHVLALASPETPIGCGRLLPDGHIGRMAVRVPWRGQGVGLRLLERLLEAARGRGMREVLLSSQTHAIPFYRRAGFTTRGPIYEEAGIPHQEMWLALSL